MNKLHYIHSRAGRLGGRADTSPDDIDAIVEALRQDARRHLVLHFHGGLVSKTAGLAIAERLLPLYARSKEIGGFPVFFVWESGAWETIRNNLTELADEPVFKQLLRKLLQYGLEQLGAEDTAGTGRSIPLGTFGSRSLEVEVELDIFWTAPSKATIPFRGYDPIASSDQARSASLAIMEDEITADLEQDISFRRALATLPDLPTTTRSYLGGSVEHRSAFAVAAAHEFSKESSTRGLVELYTVAKYLARVLRSLLRRYSHGRDHGLYATCVEELVRGFRLGGSEMNEWVKALQWNRMKQDTADAFGPNPDIHAGTALLARLSAAIDSGLELSRITLVGHSTGAIYIANWIENSKRFLPEKLKQDMVLLAPAITYDQFANTLSHHRSRMGNFRMFAMTDQFERDDQVWGQDDDLPSGNDWRRYIYPSSLLYLVSGILESRFTPEGIWEDEPDMPLLGMERFFANSKVYSDLEFPSIRVVRAWLASMPNSTVWSKTSGHAAGLNSDCFDHGSFDDDSLTVESLGHVLEVGF